MFSQVSTSSVRCCCSAVVVATEKVAIPAVSEAGVVSKWSDLDGGGGGSKAIERVKNRDYDGSLYMVNKPPRWNDQVCQRARRSRPGVLWPKIIPQSFVSDQWGGGGRDVCV